jgi:8-oxo-dGTP pyrophosphatase MutT (NUDIX family)
MEVMMGRRSAAARFMANAWVFPGGRVDESDRERAEHLVRGDNTPSQLPWILAALRETVEEAGVWLTQPPRTEALNDRDVYETLDAAGETFVADVRYFANWVTPADLPIRYDARFFATVVPTDLTPLPDDEEIVEIKWVTPRDVIVRAAEGAWVVPFPTHVTLEQLAGASSTAAFMETVASIDVETVEPRIKMEHDGSIRLILPGEPEYDDLADTNYDIEDLVAAARRLQGPGRRRIAELD